MKEPYTPTTEHVKMAYVGKHPSLYTPEDARRAEEFDRWLAKRDAKTYDGGYWDGRNWG